jgi:hypothetical protein
MKNSIPKKLLKIFPTLGVEGYSIVEMLVMASIGMIIFLALTTQMNSSRQESKRLTQKMQLLDLSRIVRTTLSSKANCEFNIGRGGSANKLTFNSTPIPALGAADPVYKQNLFTFNNLREGDSAVAPILLEKGTNLKSIDNDIKVKEISLRNWKRLEPSLFTASLTINVESSSGPLAPVTIDGVYLRTSGAGPTKTVESCAVGNMPGPGTSYYSISEVYIVKRYVPEGASVCCDKGPNDIVLSGDWSSYSGEKSTFTKRTNNNHCMEFYEGALRSQAGNIEMLCGSIP